MLDPNEVRAGNWVLKNTGTDTDTRSYFEYKAIAPDEYYYTFAKACFPIPLTPTILAKCGLKHEFGDWYINVDAEGIEEGLPLLRFREADQGWYLQKTRLWAQPQYVHQLQNLYYALTNKELDVQPGHFENLSMVGPIDFFIKPMKKRSLVRDML